MHPLSKDRTTLELRYSSANSAIYNITLLIIIVFNSLRLPMFDHVTFLIKISKTRI